MSELSHRLDVDLAGALEIAALVREPGVSIMTAAKLIEAYAGAKASEASLATVDDYGRRISAALEAPLSHKDPSHA